MAIVAVDGYSPGAAPEGPPVWRRKEPAFQPRASAAALKPNPLIMEKW